MCTKPDLVLKERTQSGGT